MNVFILFSAVAILSACKTSLHQDEEAYTTKGGGPFTPQIRFEKLITSLDSTLKQVIGDKATEEEIPSLSASGIRNDLFKIQNLAEIYEKRFAILKSIKVSSKALEDRIGGFREANEKLEFAKNQGADDSKIDALKSRLKKQQALLVDLLKDESWNPDSKNPMLSKFRSTIAGVPWDGVVEDRRFLYSSLCQVVKILDDKKWDMNAHLDDPVGLHTLKKEVRWHRIEISILADDILAKVENSCANNEILRGFDQSLEQAGTRDQICAIDGKLEELNNQDNEGRCQLSNCYLSRLDELYTLVSRLKDEAEGLEELGRPLPPGFLKPVQDAIDKIKTDRSLRMIGYELKSCANKSR